MIVVLLQQFRRLTADQTPVGVVEGVVVGTGVELPVGFGVGVTAGVLV